MSADIECDVCGKWVDPAQHFHGAEWDQATEYRRIAADEDRGRMSIEEWERKYYPCKEGHDWLTTGDERDGETTAECRNCGRLVKFFTGGPSEDRP